MELITEKKTEVLVEGGLPLCEVRTALPHAEGEGAAEARVNSFYRGLHEAVLRFCRETLLPAAAERYAADTAARRAPLRAYRLSLTTEMRQAEGEIVLFRTLLLLHRSHTLLKRTWHERVLSDGRILPVRKRQAKAKKPKRGSLPHAPR